MISVAREIHGLHKFTGEWIYLGRCPMTDEETNVFVNAIAQQIVDMEMPVFNVLTTVCNLRDFSAVRVTPPNPRTELEKKEKESE